ncbi:MAG TPA: 50S ribosomal protein L22 [Pyrinomonadaceae bacterium]|jgi:large subunit ribosomal protein L22|nr:50S ribosomal protein L22 [Pyrinomonadaceae bacterium]
MEAIAKTRHLKGSPRKARLVIDLIRGVNVSRALAILKFTDKRAADPIAKTLRSAIANATYQAEQQNIAIDPDDLWVKTCFVDMGAHKNRRRMRPAPQGRAYREQRHYCHITILVSSDEQPAAKNIKESKKGKEGDKSAGEKPVKGAKAANAAKPAVKKDAAPETKKAKKEETPVEEVEVAATEPTVEASETTSPKANEAVQEAKNEAEVADAKDATSQTPAEKNETKPADEAQLDKNEELERQ